MAGTPGRSGGQNRKRSDQRLGKPHQAQTHVDHALNVSKPRLTSTVKQPALVFPDGMEQPLPLSRELWASMAQSGYDEYFTPSDWQTCIIYMMMIDVFIRSVMEHGSWTALKLSEVRSMLGEMMTLESARRRLHIEVQRHDDEVKLSVVAPLDRAKAAGLG